jgi:8-oxo-dGTP diphosphatase
MKSPRVSVKGIIIKNKKLLFIKKGRGKDAFYILPGGGQDRYESLFDALKREVLEETGYSVNPKKILFIRDYIGKNHEFAKTSSEIHQLEIHVLSELANRKVQKPTHPDKDQTGFEWLPIKQLAKLPVYPKYLRSNNFLSLNGEYIGDVN